MAHDVNQIIAALGSPAETERAEAAERLSRLSGAEIRVAATRLVEAVSDPSEAVREAACAALEQMGPPEAGALDDLVEHLSSPSAEAAYWAATLLGRLEAGAAPAATALAEALESSGHQNVRQRAAWALGKIGPPAEPARAALQKAAASGDPRLARLAQKALEQVGP